MNPDDLKRAWQAQTPPGKIAIDPALLLQEVRRNQKSFAAGILRRDLIEMGVGLVMLPVWFVIGYAAKLPWSWYLMVPSLIWLIAYFAVDRLRHHRQPKPDDTLRERIEHSLAEVEHQIKLLRNIFWWYIFPVIPPAFAFVAHVGWLSRSAGWAIVLLMAFPVTVIVLMLVFIYRVNQRAVQSCLEPRRQELEALRASLLDESAPAP